MLKQSAKLILGLSAIVFGVFAAQALAYSELIVFGDSLSDTGNHPAATLGLPYPYYQNRISNGPNAVDTLAVQLGLTAEPSNFLLNRRDGTNYAVSGANASGIEPHDLHQQLNAYLGTASLPLRDNALYVVMIGGNDIRDAAYTSNLTQAKAQAQAAASSVNNALQRLLAQGARELLVAGVPDVGTTPESRKREASSPGIMARTTTLSQTFNAQLEQDITVLESTYAVDIRYYNAFAPLSAILQAPSQHGFDNTRDACFSASPYQFHPDCDFNTFVFFDAIHPTAKVHRIWGLGMAEALQATRHLPVNLSPILQLLLLDD